MEQYQKRKRPVPSNEPRYLTKSLLDRNGSAQETDPGKLNGGNQIQRPVSIGNFSMSKQNYLQPLDKKDGDPNEMSRLARSQPVLANIPTTSQNAETSKQAFGSHSGLIDRKDVFYHGSLHSLHQLWVFYFTHLIRYATVPPYLMIRCTELPCANSTSSSTSSSSCFLTVLQTNQTVQHAPFHGETARQATSFSRREQKKTQETVWVHTLHQQGARHPDRNARLLSLEGSHFHSFHGLKLLHEHRI